MPAIFDLLYREYCRARLAEMRKQLLMSRERHEVPVAICDAKDAVGARPAGHVSGGGMPLSRLCSIRAGGNGSSAARVDRLQKAMQVASAARRFGGAKANLSTPRRPPSLGGLAGRVADAKSTKVGFRFGNRFTRPSLDEHQASSL